MNLQDLFAMFSGGDQNAASVNRGVAPMMGPAQGPEQGGDIGSSISQFLSGLMGQSQTAASVQNSTSSVDQHTAKLRALLALNKSMDTGQGQALPGDTYMAEGDTITKGDNGKLVRGTFSRLNSHLGDSAGGKSDAIKMVTEMGISEPTARLMVKDATVNGKLDLKQLQQGAESHARTSTYVDQIRTSTEGKTNAAKEKVAQTGLLSAVTMKDKVAAVSDAIKVAGGKGISLPDPIVETLYEKIQRAGQDFSTSPSSLMSGLMPLLGLIFGGKKTHNKKEIEAAKETISQWGDMLTTGPKRTKIAPNPVSTQAIDKYLASLR